MQNNPFELHLIVESKVSYRGEALIQDPEESFGDNSINEEKNLKLEMSHLICQEFAGYIAGPTKTEQGFETIEARLLFKIDNWLKDSYQF